MIITVTLNPAVDRSIIVEDLKVDHVNRIQSIRRDIGGKGINVSKTVAALGGTTMALTVLGGENGAFIAETAAHMGLCLEAILVEGNTRENIKIIDSAHRTYTDLNEPGPSGSLAVAEQVKAVLLKMLKAKDILVISGTALPGMPLDIFSDLIDLAKQAGAYVILDVAGDALKQTIQAKPHLIKPNLHELEDFFQTTFTGLDEVVAKAEWLVTVCGIQNVVVSLGAEGVLWVNGQGARYAPALKVAVKSTVGAGDALVAGIAYGLEKQLEIDELLSFAMATATCVIQAEGSESGKLLGLESYKASIQVNQYTYKAEV